jgi:signal transduction histidine kinase
MAVLDNGSGFELEPTTVPHTLRGGMGLRIMKYRADAIGADFRIERRRRGRGVLVRCTLPPHSY